VKKLGDLGSKDAAIKRATELIDDDYVIVITAMENQAGDEVRYIVWATNERTIMTGGWNR